MKKKYRAQTGFYMFDTIPMVRNRAVFEVEFLSKDMCKIDFFEFHISWFTSWVDLGYIKEIK